MAQPDCPVLIVDDDHEIREALRDTLGDEGYETAIADDGQAALVYLRTHAAPRLILLDWNMAPMNGPRFMAEVAKDPTLATVPVVLLTADARVHDKARTASYAGFLRKPVDLGTLLSTVGRFCAQAP